MARARGAPAPLFLAALALTVLLQAAAQAPTLSKEVVLPLPSTSLESPWDLAFLPSGALLYTERCRGLSLFDGASVRFLWGTDGAATPAPDIFCEGQSGVLGVAVDPAFGIDNRFVYVYTASGAEGGGGAPSNHVARLTLAEDLSSVAERTDIVTGIAYKAQATPNGGAGSHSGGRLRFGPEGFLYITTGDNHNATLPQDLAALGGKVLRVHRNGTAVPENNTPPGGDPRIYAYGFRNVQGIDFYPGTGQPIISEHGPSYDDEVTALVAGGNGGWDPKNRPSLTCPDNYCGYAGTPETMPMTDLQRFPEAVRPSWTYGTPQDARGTGATAFLVGQQWGAWEGQLMVSIMLGQELRVLALTETGELVGETVVQALEPRRYRALEMGPDGALWVGVDEGEIWRVTAE